MDRFEVSVVMPVYNAAEFLEDSVGRILCEPEVAEIVLFEDASPDNSLAICNELAERHEKVSLYTHGPGINRGAGETRNAAIRKTTCPFIAFADADNFYLPGRFRHEAKIFADDPSIDGIYNAQGIHFANDEAERGFHEGGLTGGEFLSVSGRVPPEDFLKVFLGRHERVQMIGGLGIDAITLRRRCFEKAGEFEPRLRLQQDVHFFCKLAAACRMAAGQLDQPVALRGVHGNMRSTNVERMNHFRRMRWKYLAEWFKSADLDPERKILFRQAYEDFRLRDGRWPIWHLLKMSFRSPREIAVAYGRFDSAFRHVFGHHRLSDRALSLKNRWFAGRGTKRRQVIDAADAEHGS